MSFQRCRRSELVALEARSTVTLAFGPFKDLDHDLGVALVSPLEQRDRSQVVAFFSIQFLDLADGRQVCDGSARLPALSPVMSSISLRRIALRPRNSTLVRRVISLRAKISVYLPLLGGVSSDRVVCVEKPLGADQGLQVGLDLLVAERLANPAQ